MPPPAPPSACVVLVPIGGAIDPACDDALRELERRGHPVVRARGYSAVDAARNQLATDALARGFDELLWVDADVVFDPNDVEKLRAHGLPFTCGLYPKKGPRQFACEFLPGTPSVMFGKKGGLTEVRYCGFGFTHVRREVFEAVQRQFDLPVCNQRFGSLLVPYFQPLVVEEPDGRGGEPSGPADESGSARRDDEPGSARRDDEPGSARRAYPPPGGRWSLSEDYAFCERSRQAGFAVTADTTIRLWHVGTYRYGWEDAGSSKERYSSYLFHLPGEADKS
jgi:hypothetical protein